MLKADDGIAQSEEHQLVDRRHGIWRGKTTDVAAHDGARLGEWLIDPANTASDVWADPAYRSKADKAYLDEAASITQSLREERCHILLPGSEEVEDPGPCGACLAEQKDRMGVFIRTVGIVRARRRGATW